MTAAAVTGVDGEGAGQGREAVQPLRPEVLALDHPDWLHHHLDVTGPEEDVALFRLAAAGPGVIPWTHDRAGEEEDLFHRLASPPGGRVLSMEGCRIVAAGLRAAVERSDERARAAAGRPGGPSPLDLHRLVPVPSAVLRLGPAHPDALAWLWAHWGTTWPLRHVQARDEDRRRTGARESGPERERGRGGEGGRPHEAPGRLALAFWAADWTPWAALIRLRQDWPALSFAAQPRYDAP